MCETPPVDYAEAFSKLTKKQQIFIEKFVELNSARDAYRIAFDCKKMSLEDCRTEGYRLLRNPRIASLVFFKQTQLQVRHNITLDKFFCLVLSNYYQAIEIGALPAANKALEILGKHLGLDKINDHKNFTFDQIEEKLKLLKEQQKRIEDGK